MSTAVAQNVINEVFLRAAKSGEPARCAYCNRVIRLDVRCSAPSRATADHRMPVARGGANRPWNIAVVCNACNGMKGCLSDIEFIDNRHDPAAVKALNGKIAQGFNPSLTVYGSKEQREEARRARRDQSLARRGRLRDPDPDCEWCQGTADLPSGRRCRCSILPMTDDQRSLHIDGRPQQAC